MQKSSVNTNIKHFVERFEKDFSIKEMRSLDPERVVKFNKEVYRDEINASNFSDPEKISKRWRWKYNSNPASKEIKNFGYLADYQNTLIGQFHLMPADLKIGDRYYRSAWGSNLAVLKKYRNIGVSAFLIQHAREKISKDFTFFLLGGMNQNSFGVFEKSGFINIGAIPRYIKITDFKILLAAYGLPGFLALVAKKVVNFAEKIISFRWRKPNIAITVQVERNFGEGFKNFWNSISTHYPCIVRRDPAFLTWRYIDQPLWAYTILTVKKDGDIKGFAVVREGEIKRGKLKGKKIGVISDILIDPREAECSRKLRNEVTEFFKKKGALLVKCDILNKHVARLLMDSCFIKIKSQNSFMFKDYREKVSESFPDPTLNRSNWFISSGDSDLDFD